MKAVAYIRCSTETQATDGVSLQTQLDSIIKYADFKNIAIVKTIEDAGISGGINKARRGFMELLDVVQSGEVDAVILYSLERISRDMLTLLALEKLLSECDIVLHTCDGEIKTDTPDGFMNFAMRAFLGEMERRQVKYRTKTAMAYKKSKMEVVGSIPYGFERVADQLIPLESEQHIITLANIFYGDGLKLNEVVGMINDSGYVTRSGKPWTPQQVKRVLTKYAPKYITASRIGEAARAFIEAVA